MFSVKDFDVCKTWNWLGYLLIIDYWRWFLLPIYLKITFDKWFNLTGFITLFLMYYVITIYSPSAISWRQQVNFQWNDDEVCFVLDHHAEFDSYSTSSLKQHSVDRHVAPLGHIILATVLLKVVSRKRRRKCTLKSYDRFTNS